MKTVNEIWHDVKEEPKMYEELLLITRTAIKCLTGRYIGDGYYCLHGMNGRYTEVDKWAYVKDVLPSEDDLV